MLPEPTTLVGYIDAGTGSYLLAAIAGGIATMWFFIRAKIERLFGRKPKPTPADDETTVVAEQSEDSEILDPTSRTAE